MNAGTKDNEVNVVPVMDSTKVWTDDSDICWIPMKAGGTILRPHGPSHGALEWRVAGGQQRVLVFGRFPPDVPAGWFAASQAG